MKFRRNLLIAIMTGLLAIGGVACGGDTGGETETEGGTTMTEGGDLMTEEMMTE